MQRMLDDREQAAIEEFAAFVQATRAFAAPEDGDLDASDRRLIAAFKEQLQLYKLEMFGKGYVDQLPAFVWRRFSVGRRIPLRAPLEPAFSEDGQILEIRVYSRHLTGSDLESEVERCRGSMQWSP